MQYCTACQKAIATTIIMDLDNGAVTGSQHVCQTCAEQLGVGAPKAPPKFSAEMLEDLEAGRPLELDFLSGALVRLGAQSGVATPFHSMACRALAMHSRGKR